MPESIASSRISPQTLIRAWLMVPSVRLGIRGKGRHTGGSFLANPADLLPVAEHAICRQIQMLEPDGLTTASGSVRGHRVTDAPTVTVWCERNDVGFVADHAIGGLARIRWNRSVSQYCPERSRASSDAMRSASNRSRFPAGTMAETMEVEWTLSE